MHLAVTPRVCALYLAQHARYTERRPEGRRAGRRLHLNPQNCIPNPPAVVLTAADGNVPTSPAPSPSTGLIDSGWPSLPWTYPPTADPSQFTFPMPDCDVAASGNTALGGINTDPAVGNDLQWQESAEHWYTLNVTDAGRFTFDACA